MICLLTYFFFFNVATTEFGWPSCSSRNQSPSLLWGRHFYDAVVCRAIAALRVQSLLSNCRESSAQPAESCITHTTQGRRESDCVLWDHLEKALVCRWEGGLVCRYIRWWLTLGWCKLTYWSTGDQTGGLSALTSSCFTAMLSDPSSNASSLLGFLHLSYAKLQDSVHHALRRREERFLSEQVNMTLSWHNISVKERADSKGACTDFALFSFTPVLVPQCFFACLKTWGSTLSEYSKLCGTPCCCANRSVKSAKLNWPVGLLESYSCQIDFAQSSSPRLPWDLSANWKLLHRFPFLPFKGSLVSCWEQFGLAIVCCSLGRHLFCWKPFGNQKGWCSFTWRTACAVRDVSALTDGKFACGWSLPCLCVNSDAKGSQPIEPGWCSNP